MTPLVVTGPEIEAGIEAEAPIVGVEVAVTLTATMGQRHSYLALLLVQTALLLLLLLPMLALMKMLALMPPPLCSGIC